MSRFKSSAIFWLLIFLVAAEISARFLLPYDHIISRDSAKARNPLPQRAWPEYVSADAAENGMVLLGNSQAVGLEFPEIADIYSRQLANSLVEIDPNYILHNWSVTGLRHGQLELLSTKAIEREFRILIFVVALNNFDPITTKTIDRDPTDIPVLLGDLSLLPDVLRTKLAREASLDSVMHSVIQRHSALIRSRNHLFDVVAQILPRSQQRIVFGQRRAMNSLVPISQRKKFSVVPQVRPMQVRMSTEHWVKQLRKKQLIEAYDFYHGVNARLKETHSKMIWVWMPFALRDDTESILASMQVVHKEFCDHLSVDGVPCYDLSDKVDPSHFISPDLSSHLSKDGHEAMAELMKKIVSDAIH